MIVFFFYFRCRRSTFREVSHSFERSSRCVEAHQDEGGAAFEYVFISVNEITMNHVSVERSQLINDGLYPQLAPLFSMTPNLMRPIETARSRSI